MTLSKSLLLGSAAALVAAVSAQAADLPSKKAAPAQYVKICDAAGAGYFYIPGSDTCLKISGYVEVDAFGKNIKTNNSTNRGANNFDISTDVEIDLDTVTKTSYGDLSTHIGYEADSGASNSYNGNLSAYIDEAYITFAGLTAGRKETLLQNGLGSNGYNHSTFDADYKNNVLQYTASFGGGFSATISVEDSTGNRAGTSSTAAIGTGTADASVNGGRAPDVLGKLAIKQGWGEAALEGGYHNANYSLASGSTTSSTSTGYVVGGYAKINLPMLAAGDFIGVQALFEQNALAMGGLTRNSQRFGLLNENGSTNAYDYVVGHRQTGFTALADLKHNWTPSVSTEVSGGYAQVRYANNGTLTTLSAVNYNAYAIGQVTKFVPVKGLEFGVDTTYIRYSDKLNAAQTTALTSGTTKSNDFRVDFRVIRSF